MLNTFDADVPRLVRAAVDAEDAGLDGVWVPDHFSGAVVGRRWSRDPFACLGAVAHATRRVRIGPLVANIRNRSAPQLASAINTVASLAPGRVVLGMGSGAAPGSRFAVEHEAIGTEFGDAAFRRGLLVDQIREIRRLHDRSAPSDGRLAVTDGTPCPPIVVGASARSTVDVALEHADGVNLRATGRTVELVDRSRAARGGDFEISVLIGPDVGPETFDRWRDVGVDRLVVGVDLTESGISMHELLDVFANWVRTR